MKHKWNFHRESYTHLGSKVHIATHDIPRARLGSIFLIQSNTILRKHSLKSLLYSNPTHSLSPNSLNYS